MPKDPRSPDPQAYDCPTDVDDSGDTSASDLTVLLGSWGPCAPGLAGVDVDLDNTPRFVQDLASPDTGNGDEPLVDMGAYEFCTAEAAACPADVDESGDTGPFDLAFLLGNWGPVGPNTLCLDADDDGDIGPFDLAFLLGRWGPCQ